MAIRQRLVTAAVSAVAVVGVLLGAACGKVCTPTVTPANASVLTCSTQQLTAGVPDGCKPEVTWSVAGGGTIDASGLYSAPKQVPNPATVTVTATSVETKEEGSTTITLSTALPSAPIAAGPSSVDEVFHHQAAARGAHVYAVQNSQSGGGTSAKQFTLKVSSSTDGGKSFGAPVKVNDSPADVDIDCQAVAADAADAETVYVVYRLGSGAVDKTADTSTQKGGATLAMAVSTDGGKTFTNHVLESHVSGFAICPDIASPAPGAVLVTVPAYGMSAGGGEFTTYLDTQKGAGFASGQWDLTTTYTTDEHATVQTYTWALNDGGSAGLESPRLSTDGAGKVCITYVGGPSLSELRATTQCSANKGASFGAPVDVEAETPGTRVHHPIGLFGPNSFTVAYWREGDTTAAELRLAKSANFGERFTAPTTVPAYAIPDGRKATPQYPAIAWDGDVLWIAYLVGDGLGPDRLIVDKSCDGGATWSGAQILNGPEPEITTGADWPTLIETDAGPLLVARRGNASEDLPQQAIRLVP